MVILILQRLAILSHSTWQNQQTAWLQGPMVQLFSQPPPEGKCREGAQPHCHSSSVWWLNYSPGFKFPYL